MPVQKIKRIAVIGAGIMGHGFAQLFASKGYKVTAVDNKKDVLERAEKQIISNLELLRDEGFIEVDPSKVMASITFTMDQRKAAEDADFVLEAVSEDMAIKRKVFSELDAQAPKHAILASNTSGLSITEMSEATNRPEKVIGCHWWNPPYLMPLVELILGRHTSQETVDITRRFVESLGREVVVAKKEVPGFLWNRLQVAVMREALHLVEEGVASAKDMDKVVKRGYALRSIVIGPFETIDLAGLKLWRTIVANLSPELCKDGKPNPIFDEKIGRGELGVQAGKGFHNYMGRTAQEVIRDRDRKLIRLLKCVS